MGHRDWDGPRLVRREARATSLVSATRALARTVLSRQELGLAWSSKEGFLVFAKKPAASTVVVVEGMMVGNGGTTVALSSSSLLVGSGRFISGMSGMEAMLGYGAP